VEDREGELLAVDKKGNKNTGNEGEQIAREYLEQKGYSILDMNLTLPFGEIDILAKDKKTIVIVEVKTVRGSGFGLAQELVRFKKQKKLILLASALEQKFPKSTIRIDVIGVEMGGSEPVITHLESAVERGSC